MGDDVRGFDVAMDDVIGVREVECRADGRHDQANVGRIHSAARLYLLSQARTTEQLHHEIGRAVRRHVEVVDGDDGRMAKARGDAALAHESLARKVGGHIRPDDLECDFVPEQYPARPIHLPHAPFGKGREDLISVVENVPGREHVDIRTWGIFETPSR